MALFNQTMHPTPFGLYDSSASFQRDADNMVIFVFRKLGEDVLSVELTKKEIWSCFEEATREFNGMIIEYQAQSNLVNLLGGATGSLDANGNPTINLTNVYVGQNLEFLDRQAEPYANIIGYGQTQNSFSGSIQLQTGIQDYDIYSLLIDPVTKNTIYNQYGGGSGKMRVLDVYHFMPIQYVFNSNLASNFVAQGMPVESYIPDTRFYVLPVFEDILRAGMLKTASKVRKSHYSFRISGRFLKIYPAPNGLQPGFNDTVWLRVNFPSNAYPVPPSGSFIDTVVDANGNIISGISGSLTNASAASAAQYFGASNPANVPFGLINYDTINQWAKNWITQYTAALSREILGGIRGKLKSIPIAGESLELNGADLVSQAREDKEALKTSLKEKLESMTYAKLQEQATNQAENLLKQMSFLPVPGPYAIKIW